MNALLTAIREVYGLFVEDGSYAASLVAWLLFVGLALPRLPALGQWRGPILLVGAVALLVENVVRTARDRARGE